VARVRRRLQVHRLDDAVQEPVVVRLLRADQPAGEHQLRRVAGTAQPRQQHRRGVRDHEADPDLRAGEPRARRRDAQVARARELERAADADAVDRRDHRNRQRERDPGQLVEALDDGAPLVQCQVGRRLEVVTRREGAARAAHDEHAHPLPRPGIPQSLGEPREILRRERVQDTRLLEDDARDRVVDGGLEPHQPGSSPA
jgi:hypothetical protein